MGRMDWTHLQIVEKWAAIEPSDINALAIERERIKELSSLILKAFRRHQLAKAKHLKPKANDAEQNIEE